MATHAAELAVLDDEPMNPIELLILGGRILAVVATFAVIGWFSSRRARTNTERTS